MLLLALCGKLPLMVWDFMRVMWSCFGAGGRRTLPTWVSVPGAAIAASF